ncbi:MAG: L-threonylcarbamoyladenylate synthase [Desulfocapsaceae bacterium]|jgi:L-threonylcarbamoyladenylate synthase|nr:L-threonylcarbamoyladenylate synthase [Desulfocapsaceae bacterium]
MKRQKKSYPEIISADSPDCSQHAAAVIRGGGIVAFPTETYYGLGVNPFDHEALRRLFEVKKRPRSKAILVIIDTIEQLYLLVSDFPEPFRALTKQYWPGPLTLIFPALPGLSKLLTGDTQTVGIRMSSSKTATGICRACGFPVSATSANISGTSPSTCVDDILQYFGSRVDLVIDGGKTAAAQCSTIAAVEDGRVRIIRPGMVTIQPG